MDSKLHEGIALCLSQGCVPRVWHILRPNPIPDLKGDLEKVLPHLIEADAFKCMWGEHTRLVW